MTEKDCIVRLFFSHYEPTENELKTFYETYWLPVGAQWLIQRSERIAEQVVRIAIENNSQYAIESLQIAINDLMATGGLKVVREDGYMSPKVIEWLDHTLQANHAGEDNLLDHL